MNKMGLFVPQLTLLFTLSWLSQAKFHQQEGDPSVPTTLDEYERCKATHRCNRAFSWYDKENASHTFASSAYLDGVYDYASLFSDFEDWQVGTHGWSKNGNTIFEERNISKNSHFNSFDFPILGSLILSNNSHVIFNTTDATVEVFDGNSNSYINLEGVIDYTTAGTKVAIFNFLEIEIEANVSVTGDKGMALLSRSSIILGSAIKVAPGTLGGFPGGLDTGINNRNGPGSSSERVYLFTVKTRANDVNEIQTITTSAYKEQTLSGFFTLSFRGFNTHSIPHDATPELVKARLEAASHNVGKVQVSRGNRTEVGGYTWTVTFLTAVGNIPQLKVVHNNLNSIDAHVKTNTLQDGNSIGGTFKLSMFNHTTAPLPHNATSSQVEEEILKAFKPDVIVARVQRSDASTDSVEASFLDFGTCDHGMCVDSPGKAGGLTWAILVTTYTDNVVPTSPTHALYSIAGVESILSADGSGLTGNNVSIHTSPNHSLQHARSFSGLNFDHTFTISYNGAGGSFGGIGEFNNVSTYEQSYLYDLIGGSGGGIGGFSVREIVAHYPPAGMGGHGGGAFELSAVNDITIKNDAGISVNGGKGGDAYYGGGGGSGGSIVVSAGGIIWLQKTAALHAVGGLGGSGTARKGGSGSGGRIVISGQAVTISDQNTNVSSPCLMNYAEGTLFVHTEFAKSFHVDPDIGAAGTERSLKVTTFETLTSSSSSNKKSPYVRNGPQYSVAYDMNEAPPNRISLFFRIAGTFIAGTIRDNWSAFIALHDLDINENTMIGVAAVNSGLVHGANFVHMPSDKIYSGVEQDTWIKLDILVDWNAKTYDIRINDMEQVIGATFKGEGISSIGLYGYHGATVWFDEVFVGRDDSANFRCPRINSENNEVNMKRPIQTNWKKRELSPQDETTPVKRHTSHLSEREMYRYEEVTGMIYSGGQLHQRFISEYHRKEFDDYEAFHSNREGRVDSGALLFSPESKSNKPPRNVWKRTKTTAALNERDGAWSASSESIAFDETDTIGSSGRYYWYGEHRNDMGEDHLKGGVMSCSTTDFVNWRNEGTMLHFANLSYDGGVPRTHVEILGGYDGIGVQTYGRRHEVEVTIEDILGIGNWTDEPLRAERPKVLYNNQTEKYVMWMEVHDLSNELGVAAVATSSYPSGPFEFVSSFLPDGNETHDQTVVQKANGEAILVRTYYSTVDYILPKPVMQPMWESVKGEDGSVDFGLNYHRATYDLGYDDSDDICIQRLRKETIPFQTDITPENETMPVSEWIKNAYTGDGTLEYFVLEEQDEPWLEREIIGQGNPAVESRFKHPNWTVNNHWMPSSVPAVKAQEWTYNYRDHNIADNVIHKTLPDKLIGPPQVVEQRRTKYIAISLLSPDYLNTSGVLKVVEGGVEDEINLISFLTDENHLNFHAQADDAPINKRRFYPHVCDGGIYDDEWEDCNLPPLQNQHSTTPGQVWGLDAPFNFITEKDWSWRLHQYRWEKTDRAHAPINFKDQLVEQFVPGRGESRTTRGRSFRREYDHNCFRGPNEYPEGHPDHVPADDLFMNELSQHYTKTEGADIASTRAHLLDW